MLNKFAKFLLIATSVAPLLLIFGLAELFQPDISAEHVVFYLGTGIALFLLCCWVIQVAKTKLMRLPFHPTSIHPTAVGWVLTAYLFPGVTFVYPQMILPVSALCLGILMWGARTYPLLRIIGYKTHNVATAQGRAYLLLSRRAVQEKELCNVIQLTDYLVLDVNKSESLASAR